MTKTRRTVSASVVFVVALVISIVSASGVVEPEPVEPEPVEPIEPVETTVVVVKVVVIVVEELESAVGFAVVLDVFVLVSCALVLGGPSLSTPLLSNLQEESTRKKTARIRSCPAPARPPQYPHMKTNERKALSPTSR